jgi:peptide methionine sulfoxide reductase MsrB
MKIFAGVIFELFFCAKQTHVHHCPRSILRMDDEVARLGIKTELTTRDAYLQERFTGLSQSGHDLTPLLDSEVRTWMEEHPEYAFREGLESDANNKGFLGCNQKGIYVCAIGGLPLYASGTRVDKLCDKDYVVFEEPCDSDHIDIDVSGTAGDEKIYCKRSRIPVGVIRSESGKAYHAIEAGQVRFFDVGVKWPAASQPENFWGSEGQYRAWNEHELSARPLSY